MSSLWLVSPSFMLVVFSSFLSHPEDRSLLPWLYFCIPASPSCPPSRSSSTLRKAAELRAFLNDTGVFTPAGRAKAPLIDLLLHHPSSIPQALRLAEESPFVLHDDGHIVDRQTSAERREPLPSEQAAHASTITQPSTPLL